MTAAALSDLSYVRDVFVSSKSEGLEERFCNHHALQSSHLKCEPETKETKPNKTKENHIIMNKVGSNKKLLKINEKKSTQKIKSHIRVRVGRVNFVCTYCYKAFHSSESLDGHCSSVHSGAYPLTCLFCDKGFHANASLNKHQSNVHYGVKKYKCKFCGRSFPEMSNLKTHEATLHDPSRSFECGLCECRFLSKSYLQGHVERSHLGPKLKCSSCTETFTSKPMLQKHCWNIHSRKVKLANSHSRNTYYCGEKFSRRGSLIQHQINSKDRVTVCAQCPNTFSILYKCEQHELKVHDTNQRFQCQICKKLFTSHRSMTNHKEKKHASNNAFAGQQCIQCDYWISSFADMTLHVLSHLTSHKYSCVLCGDLFCSPLSLKSHERCVHLVTAVSESLLTKTYLFMSEP